MECQQENDVSEEPIIAKNGSSIRELNGEERAVNDIIVLYDYETEQSNEDYDLAMDGILLNGCSQYLFKFSIIVLPIIFLMVIVFGIFENDQQNNELRCKISRALIVIGISVGLLAFYFLCRYGFHMRSLYQTNQRNAQNSDLGLNNTYKQNKMSKKQLKFILQNPWNRIRDSEPKEQYSNHVDIYVENGLYNISNNIV